MVNYSVELLSYKFFQTSPPFLGENLKEFLFYSFTFFCKENQKLIQHQPPIMNRHCPFFSIYDILILREPQDDNFALLHPKANKEESPKDAQTVLPELETLDFIKEGEISYFVEIRVQEKHICL